MAENLHGHGLLSNCKQATLLLQKRDSGKISVGERIRLWIHLAYCSLCRRFARQSSLINERMDGFAKHLHEQPPYHLSLEKKKSMELMIKELKKED